MADEQTLMIESLARASQQSGQQHLVPPHGMVVSNGQMHTPSVPALEQRRAAVSEVLDRHLMGLDFQIRAVLIDDLLRVW